VVEACEGCDGAEYADDAEGDLEGEVGASGWGHRGRGWWDIEI